MTRSRPERQPSFLEMTLKKILSLPLLALALLGGAATVVTMQLGPALAGDSGNGGGH